MQKHDANSLAATAQLLQLKGITYQPLRLKDDLLGHPDYPSLFAVHQVLSQYGLNNSAVHANADQLDKLGQPFLAYMDLPSMGTDFVAVTQVGPQSITYTNARGKAKTIDRQDFLNKWKNVAVMVDAASGEQSAVGNAANKKNTSWFLKNIQSAKNLKMIGWVTILMLITTLVINTATPLILAPWLLLKMTGLSITILLLMYEADKESKTVKKFCHAGKTINCDAVLQSRGAKIGFYSWSEMGFAYFSGGLLYLIFAGTNIIALLPLALLSVLALPYTIYSVYYQYKIVKQWCKLCIFIQVIILIESIFLIITFLPTAKWMMITDNWQTALLLPCFMLLPFIGWLLLKPTFKKAATTDGFKYGYLRLQNNPDVFKAMLQKQQQAPTGYAACSLLIGNAEANIEILKVCNPFCGPCAAAHNTIERLMVKNRNIKLRIMWLGSNATNNPAGTVAKHFISIYHTQGQAKAEAAMHYWYNNHEKNAEDLALKYPTQIDEQATVLKEAMNQWTEVAEITHTPTIYINGYALPIMYNLQDLKSVL